MNEKKLAKINDELKLLLHASRDWQRNNGQDTSILRHDVNSPYYGEAFGIMRCLYIMEDMSWASLDKWFHDIAQEVLNEENFYGNNECDFCVTHYGKDGAGRKRN